MTNPVVQPPASAYFITPEKETTVARTLAILVDNEPGVLARVIGMFSGRGYNIESLTVSETEHEKHLSRITVVTRGAPHVIEQLKSQLDRIVPVHRVVDLTSTAGSTGESQPIERELAIVKVAGKGEKRVEALRLADVFRAKVVDSSIEHFVFEITGRPSKLDKFVGLMAPLGLVEVCRTGVAALSRGMEGM
ncbi:acetolactate synthase small subunit [Aurantimonas sp. 22II-16-19i]|uniref:acetolactate synthase small subunit n=1 Tax=Aurantimonas sp. 22II-16-19i TaxID=1317114 RepID=UPI0009F7DFBA|nr:acetolactate synthase small subunit [Aurantimonas sp. 22II-16-19i]MAU98410.1 acetolactate synthase small subunit [Fulvimarina sp.]ORE99122.1 acetolactate synthase 3 regulatory subunit [Aurantimonas sp. 22II-16-19i]